jgi:hypothetical protein
MTVRLIVAVLLVLFGVLLGELVRRFRVMRLEAKRKDGGL